MRFSEFRSLVWTRECRSAPSERLGLSVATLGVFGVEGGVTPTSNGKQIQDIGASEVARNGKVKKSEFYPQKIFGWVACYQNCRGGIDNRISCEKFMKIGPVKLQLHAGEVLRLCNGRANWTFRHFEPHAKFDRN